jgi:calcium-dependent protein kinase
MPQQQQQQQPPSSTQPIPDPHQEVPIDEVYKELTVTENEFGTNPWSQYNKMKLLSDTGTGEIWLACRSKKNSTTNHDNDDGQQSYSQIGYAIKCIDKSFLSGMFAKELQNEIDVLRQLDHPNIVRIYETYEDRSYMYLVMEYCTLGDLTKRFPYTEEEVKVIVRQLLSAIIYCHQHKVVHRDLKLENIVWASPRTIKLIDFGYAQKYTSATRRDYEMKLDVGTKHTQSPQVLTGEKYSERTDEWGVGVITYMLLTGGKLPYDATSNADIRHEIKLNKHVSFDWDKSGDDISQEGKDFVQSLLEYDEDRRTTAEEALRSPWLFQSINDDNGTQQQQASPSDADVDDEVVLVVDDALLSSAQEPKLKRLSKLIIAHDIPEHQIEDLRDIFVTKFDTTKDGTISLEEFKSTILEHNSNMDDVSKLEYIFSELDLNNNGTISYTDFLAATIESHNGAVINEELIEDAFDKLTMGPNRTTIEPDDIQAVLLKSSSCSKNDPNNTKSSDVSEEAKYILEEVNPENGTVDYETFAAMFERNDEQNQSS